MNWLHRVTHPVADASGQGAVCLRAHWGSYATTSISPDVLEQLSPPHSYPCKRSKFNMFKDIIAALRCPHCSKAAEQPEERLNTSNSP